MAGFEVIVRPVVFPNIRPLPSRSLPPEDDPTKGQAVLSGSSGQVIALTHSYSASASTSGGTETQRDYDVARIRSSGGGDAYIDVEIVNKIRTKDGNGNTQNWHYTPIEPSENIDVISRNQTRNS